MVFFFFFLAIPAYLAAGLIYRRLRIGRAEVRRCLGQTTLAVLSNGAIRRLYARQRLALDAMTAAS